MRTYTSLFLQRTYAQLAVAATTVTVWLATGCPTVGHRSRAEVEEGSETTEKAVITAISLGVAVALGAAITAVVRKYQAQIHSQGPPMSASTVHTRRREREEGSSSLELAVLAPLALVLVLTVLQAGLWFYAHSVCEHAAQRGIAIARTVSGTSSHAEQAAHTVTDRAPGLIAHPVVTAQVGAQGVRVQVSAHVARVLPIPGLDLGASQTASAAKERFTTPGTTP